MFTYVLSTLFAWPCQVDARVWRWSGKGSWHTLPIPPIRRSGTIGMAAPIGRGRGRAATLGGGKGRRPLTEEAGRESGLLKTKRAREGAEGDADPAWTDDPHRFSSGVSHDGPICRRWSYSCCWHLSEDWLFER